jgi:hypothetical protein
MMSRHVVMLSQTGFRSDLELQSSSQPSARRLNKYVFGNRRPRAEEILGSPITCQGASAGGGKAGAVLKRCLSSSS